MKIIEAVRLGFFGFMNLRKDLGAMEILVNGESVSAEN